MNDILSPVLKTAIGVLGTSISFALQNLSEVAAIIAALATAIYMFQQFLNSREKGRQLKNKD